MGYLVNGLEFFGKVLRLEVFIKSENCGIFENLAKSREVGNKAAIFQNVRVERRLF